MKKLFIIIIIFQSQLISSQSKRPCLKGDCENGLGMSKISDKYKYIAFHKNNYRNGLTLTYNENKNRTYAYMNSTNGKTDGVALIFVKENEKIRKVYIKRYINGRSLDYSILMKYTDKGIRFGGLNPNDNKITWFENKKVGLTNSSGINGISVTSRNGDNKFEAHFYTNKSIGKTYVTYIPGDDWSLNISTKPNEKKKSYKTVFNWTNEGLKMTNPEYEQEFKITDVVSVPQNFGTSYYRDENTIGFVDLFYAFMRKD